MESLTLIGNSKVREVLNSYSDYTLYIRKGFAFRGAKEVLEDKQTKSSPCPGGFKVMTFDERMERIYEHYVAYDVDIDHENKKLHLNAFSANDMY